jgi:4-azaleucine resistance transporter AzlC
MQEGFPWYYATLFSTFVLAGAMQFLALTILAAGGTFLTIALAIIPLGIRNIFYGMTMLERYRPINPFLRLYLAHGLVDTTYSLLSAGPCYTEKEDIRYITYLTVIIHVSWVLGSLLGSLVFYFVNLPPGLEFSLTTFFAAASVEQFLQKKEWKSVWIAASAIALALLIAPHHLFLAAIGFSILATLALPSRRLA